MTTIPAHRAGSDPRGPYRPTEPLPNLLGPQLTGAACKGLGGLFDDHHDQHEPTETRAERHRQAIKICYFNCPIRTQCLDTRTADPTLGGGIWGGRLFNTEPATRRCPCSTPLPDHAPASQKYCTEQCGDNHRKRQRPKTTPRTATCALPDCHQTFTTKLPTQQFCRTEHRRAYWVQVEAERRAAAREQRKAKAA